MSELTKTQTQEQHQQEQYNLSIQSLVCTQGFASETIESLQHVRLD